jgi:hypothetical protein
MDPKDIGASQALGTNVLHYGAYRVLGRMARLLGEPAERWDRIAAAVKRGIDGQMWQPERGYYGQYLYGRLGSALSPRAEHLGEALSVVIGVADSAQRRAMAERTPVVPFGVPSFWPYIPDVAPYHNAGVWPQVVGFWAWASADAGNAAGVEHALANLYRAAGLFLTNKENWVATTGHFEGTEVNSDRFQASAAAQLAATYKVLFGIRLDADRMRFEPFVPRAYAGTRTLRNLRYRNAVLTVIVRGFGNEAREVRLDGRIVSRAEIPATLSGAHTLDITLNDSLPAASIHLAANVAAPRTPQPELSGNEIVWAAIDGATGYVVFRDGRRGATAGTTKHAITPASGVVEYQVLAIDANGLESFLSEPIRVGPPAATQVIEPARELLETEGEGYEGRGYLTLTNTSNTTLKLTVRVPVAGLYAIDARYANGSGPVSYGYRASARGLVVDGKRAGTLLLPQRGNQRWDNWGYTNAISVWLGKGEHSLSVTYGPEFRNMDGVEERARLDHVRVSRLAREGSRK